MGRFLLRMATAFSRFRWDRNEAPDSCFDAFSLREPVSTSLENAKILLSGPGRLSDTAQLFDALDARSNFEPIMQSVRDLNKLDDA
jgi:hypothetical protein